MMQPVPDRLRQTITEVFAEAGIAWLQMLPELLDECAHRWNLTILPPFPNLSYNYVAPARRADGATAVLKVGVPHPELRTEIAALYMYDGHGMARLLESDATRGALLLEHLAPGTPLTSKADDAEATTIAAQVMRQLWRPIPADHPFPTVATWAAGLSRLREHYAGGSGPLPEDLVVLAETLFAELLASQGPAVLLHGDLHHDNILAAGEHRWLAIDPKGLVGEAEYEVGALLRNPLPQLLAQSHPERVMAHRVAILASELSFDRQRIVNWGIAQAILSAWWTIEDHGHDWEPMITIARILVDL